MKKKCLIVDDEPIAQQILEQYIQKIEALTLVGKSNNAFDAMIILHKEVIDIMFLDIRMPSMSGLELLKTLQNPPSVILTTAFSEFGAQSYEYGVIDYLLKPISFNRFMKAVNKAIEQVNLTRNQDAGTTAPPAGGATGEYIFVKADKKLVKVNYDDIIYIEGLKDYVIIRQNSSRVITLQTMKSLEEKLPSKLFKRIHRSYIINVNKINAVVGNMVEVEEKGQTKHLPIGKNYRDELLKIVNQNKL